MPSEQQNPITLFCYPGSPWSAKIEIYLAIRRIPYAACHQPMTWPRPDIQSLSISYRRIPILAIGRDIYCDTALIIQKLELIFPSGSLGASNDREKALEDLLEQWSQTAIMRTGPAFLPPSVPLLADPTFLEDRKALWGDIFSPETFSQALPGLLVEIGLNLDVIEKFLSDGRFWLQNTEEPSLADIHAAFFFQWAIDLSADFLEDRGVNTKTPHSYAFLKRYQAIVTACRTDSPDLTLIEGTEAVSRMQGADFAEIDLVVEEDPTGLKFGQTVAVFRTDDISGHKDVGTLIALSPRESVIEVSTNLGLRLHVHCPRRNFIVSRAE